MQGQGELVSLFFLLEHLFLLTFSSFFVIPFLKHSSINSNAPQVLQQSPGIHVSFPFITLSLLVYMGFYSKAL